MDQRLGASSDDALAQPECGGRSLTTEERARTDLSSTINGWGSDLNPAVRPGVPRDKAPELGVESLYPPVPRQEPRVRIHKSTEHERLTPVFGTSCPPTGLSGKIRDIGYRFSEGRLARWMTLMFADRVNVVEDILSDLARGHVPNIAKEMGLKSELTYNRARLARNALIAGACIVALLAYKRKGRG